MAIQDLINRGIGSAPGSIEYTITGGLTAGTFTADRKNTGIASINVHLHLRDRRRAGVGVRRAK